MTKRQPVAGVRLQVLDDVFGDGTNDNGLALAKVDQVGSDLRAVVARGVPANTQAGGRRVERRWAGAAVLVFLIFVGVQRSLVPLQLGLLQHMDAADGGRDRAGRLAQHGLAEGPHARHIHSLQDSNTAGSSQPVTPRLTTRWSSNVSMVLKGFRPTRSAPVRLSIMICFCVL